MFVLILYPLSMAAKNTGSDEAEVEDEECRIRRGRLPSSRHMIEAKTAGSDETKAGEAEDCGIRRGRDGGRGLRDPMRSRSVMVVPT